MNAKEAAKWVLALGTVIELALFVIPATLRIIIEHGARPSARKHRWKYTLVVPLMVLVIIDLVLLRK